MEIKPRLVVITRGANQTILASPSLLTNTGHEADLDKKYRAFDILRLAEAEIIDTNAAGDAFAGGFLGQ
jgi:adenosine kinase